MRFDEHFLRGAVPGSSVLHGSFPDDPQFSVDTRLLQEGNIFIALEGERVDGHRFIPQAFESGAAGVLMAADKKDILNAIDARVLAKKLVMLVPDTLRALKRIAAAWRTQFEYPVIGITGSVGKTSTKQIVCNILDLHGMPYVASSGTQNTQIGASLNMLRMRDHHKMAIFEMGISKRGEMAKLAQLIKPTTAAITYIGHSHMEGLGSLVDIALEKRDIFKYFTENSIGIINGDQAILAQVGYSHPVIKFGSKTINQIQARKVNVGNKDITFMLKIYKQKYQVTLKQVHEGAVLNALAATAITQYLGVPHKTIVKGIEIPVHISGRFESLPIKGKRGTIINDCYNANPESMKAALLAFQHLEGGSHKVAVLGDMLELGVNSPFWHRQLGRFLRKVPSLNRVILVGNMVQWTRKTLPVGLPVEQVATWEDAVQLLEKELLDKSAVLVKGSRGMQLNKLVDHFTQAMR